MPTYEYKCSACGHQFEKFQSITAAPIKTCPQCGKHKVVRLIGTGAGLIFKGSGFYITDYRSDSYKNAAKSDSSSSSSSNSSSGSTSGSTPAASTSGSASSSSSGKTSESRPSTPAAKKK